MVYRIDDTTAVSTLPARPTDNIGTPGFFTGGSTGGQAATRVRFWWLNMVQEELIAIAMAAGLTLDKSNNGQVLAAIKKLIANAFGGNIFTPVQQGGGSNQTGDKINLGQDSTYAGLLRLAISGVDKGNLLSGTWGATITGLTNDLPGLGLWFQHATQRPAFAYQTPTGGATSINLPNQADVQVVQTNLTSAVSSQSDINSGFSAEISNSVSGVYGKSSGDYQVLGLYQQVSTGRPIAVFNNGTATVYNGIANYTDVTTVQTNLTSFQAQQANQNTTFASDIAARIPTNAANDGTNAPITLMNFYLATGMLWFSANGIQSNVAQTNPGDGWNAIKNITVEDDSGALTVLDTTGKTNTYQPCSADIQSDTVSVTKVGDLVIQTFEATITNPNNGGAGSVTVTLPQALTKSIQFAKGNALGGTQGGTSWIPSVNVLPTSLTQVTIYADNLQDENWTAAVPVQVMVIGS